MPPVARPFEDIPAESITIREGVVVGKAGARDLTADLYLPPVEGMPRPALVILHGGGWRKGSTRGVRGYGELLSRMGFVCLCADYRLSGEAQWPAQIEDVKCVIRYAKANCLELGIDPQRVGVTGDSSGGHLALMAAVEADFDGAGGHEAYSSLVKAVGTTYPPVRIPHKRDDDLPSGLMPTNASLDDYYKASPISYDLSKFPPCLLIHGAEDPAVPLSGTIELYTKLASLGRAVELHVFAGEGHAFDRRKPGQERMVDVADPDSIYGLTVIRLVAHFFAKYL